MTRRMNRVPVTERSELGARKKSGAGEFAS